MIRYFLDQLRWRSVWHGAIATAILAFLIILGSRNLADFDSALIGYTMACLFMIFGIVYRYSVWLSKPPTRLYWRRGWQIFFNIGDWPRINRIKVLFRAIFRRILIQDFVWHRGAARWLGHMLIAWGCILAFAITFPLVFGWIHFEQGVAGPTPSYRMFFFGFEVREITISGIEAWFVFHGLVIAAVLVTAGVMIVMYRRMRDHAALSVQRFSRDFLPLIILFAVSVSGLMLWASYEYMEGYYYGAIAQFHAVAVIALLLSLPFGKLFHVMQRPASIGVSFYREVGDRGEQAVCPVTGEEFAPKLQTDDLNKVLPELGFDYSTQHGEWPNWNEVSPRGKRKMIGRAHNAVRKGRFS